MAAFKAHAALIVQGAGERMGMEGGGMGHYGKLRSVEEMPVDEQLLSLIRSQADHVRSSAKPARAAPNTKPELAMPDDFGAALMELPAANAAFDDFAPSHRREYVK
jgi:uncharacterized protein YdeI (YjbR/CyaY-like superfamily)